MAFAAGALVFPGGRIDEADRHSAIASRSMPHAVAAIRETVEETAVPVGLRPFPDPRPRWRLQRAAGRRQAVRRSAVAKRLRARCGRADAFARWVPKFHAVRRFDTLFYVAALPDGDWHPRVIEGECAGAFWLTAGGGSGARQRGEARLIFPTRRNLERLAQHSSFEEIRADALAHPIEPVTPWVEEREGEKFITIPDHLGYPVTQERLDGLWRG